MYKKFSLFLVVFFTFLITLSNCGVANEREVKVGIFYPTDEDTKVEGSVKKNEWHPIQESCRWWGILRTFKHSHQDGKYIGTNKQFVPSSNIANRFQHSPGEDGSYDLWVYLENVCHKPGKLTFSKKSRQSAFRPLEEQDFQLALGRQSKSPISPIVMVFDGDRLKVHLYFESASPTVSTRTTADQEKPVEIGIFHRDNKSEVTGSVGAGDWREDGTCAWKGSLYTFTHRTDNKRTKKQKHFRSDSAQQRFQNKITGGNGKKTPLKVFLRGRCLNLQKPGQLIFSQSNSSSGQKFLPLIADNFELSTSGGKKSQPSSIRTVFDKRANQLRAYLYFGPYFGNQLDVVTLTKDSRVKSTLSWENPYQRPLDVVGHDYDSIEVETRFGTCKPQKPESGTLSIEDCITPLSLTSNEPDFELGVSHFTEQGTIFDWLFKVDGTKKTIALPNIDGRKWILEAYKPNYIVSRKELIINDIKSQDSPQIDFSFSPSSTSLTVTTKPGALVSVMVVTAGNKIGLLDRREANESGKYQGEVPIYFSGRSIKITAQKEGYYVKSIDVPVTDDEIRTKIFLDPVLVEAKIRIPKNMVDNLDIKLLTSDGQQKIDWSVTQEDYSEAVVSLKVTETGMLSGRVLICRSGYEGKELSIRNKIAQINQADLPNKPLEAKTIIVLADEQGKYFTDAKTAVLNLPKVWNNSDIKVGVASGLNFWHFENATGAEGLEGYRGGGYNANFDIEGQLSAAISSISAPDDLCGSPPHKLVYISENPLWKGPINKIGDIPLDDFLQQRGYQLYFIVPPKSMRRSNDQGGNPPYQLISAKDEAEIINELTPLLGGQNQ